MNRDDPGTLPPADPAARLALLRSAFTRHEDDELRVVCSNGHPPETVAVIDTRGRVLTGTHLGQLLDPEHHDMSEDFEALETATGARRRFRLACPTCSDEGGPVATFTADRLHVLARYRRLAGPVVDLSVLARYIST